MPDITQADSLHYRIEGSWDRFNAYTLRSRESEVPSPPLPEPDPQPVTDPGWKLLDWPVCYDGNPAKTYAKLRRIVRHFVTLHATLLPPFLWTDDGDPSARTAETLNVLTDLRDGFVRQVTTLWQCGRISSVIHERDNDTLLTTTPDKHALDHLAQADRSWLPAETIYGKTINRLIRHRPHRWLITLTDHTYLSMITPEPGQIELRYDDEPAEIVLVLNDSRKITNFTVLETFSDFTGHQTRLKLIGPDDRILTFEAPEGVIRQPLSFDVSTRIETDASKFADVIMHAMGRAGWFASPDRQER